MIFTIARKEFVEMTRDGRFRTAALLVLGLLLAALARDGRAERETAARVTRAQWLNQGEKSPHAGAHYGVYAFKPRMPLSFVDTGVDPYVGTLVWLEAHKQNEWGHRLA